MKTKRIFYLLITALLPWVAWADVWQDPNTKVNYSYTIGSSSASVMEGTYHESGDTPGSPEVSGVIEILSNFTVDGKEYTVTSVGSYAFSGCSELTSVILPESIERINSTAFGNCCNLTSIQMGSHLTTINIYAFWRCSSLTSVRIPDSVKSIYGYAFSGCSELETIIIGNGIEEIYNSVFSSCPKITDVYCLANTMPSTDSNAFRYSSLDNATLHVPGDMINMYRSAEPWSGFSNVVALKEGEPDNTNQDAVTIKANSYTRLYGDPNPTFGYTVTEGTILSGQPEFTCAATQTSPVGTYDIILSKGTLSNSSVNLEKGTLTITKAPLTISAGNYEKKEGEPNPSFIPTFRGFKNGETNSVLTRQPVINCAATTNSPAGTYPVTVSGAEAQNYDINYEDGILTVIAKSGPGHETGSTAKTLVIHLKNGTTTDVELYTQPRIEFKNDKVLITSPVLNMEYPKTDVLRFTYKGGSLDATSPKADTEVTRDGDRLVFHNVKATDQVAVYTVHGIRVPVRFTRSGNTATLSLSQIPSGVYLLSVNGRTSKFTKQ